MAAAIPDRPFTVAFWDGTELEGTADGPRFTARSPRALAYALTGLLWGGAVRILVLHHVTFSINSLCHFFGRKRFDTGDESRNLAWLSFLSLGEAWHNNHHAFPTSAAHGLRWWELDLSSAVIRSLERVGLAWDVVRIDPARQQRKLLAGST